MTKRFVFLTCVWLLAVARALAETFSVGAVNCGAFRYGKADVPADAYAEEWRKLGADNATDVFFYGDVGKVAARWPGDIAAKGLDIRAAGRAPQAIDVVSLPRTITVDGEKHRTPRYRALRLTYPFAGGTLAVYGLHLVAEGHIRVPKPAAEGQSFSQKLRQEQFAALIEDAKKFDHAILCSDFNAQRPSEYDVFVRAGFKIANGSARFGTRATLRNIPADNIILSPSLAFDDFKVLDGYQLDTDHFPVVARVTSDGRGKSIPARNLQNLPCGAARRRTYVGEASSPPQVDGVLQVPPAIVLPETPTEVERFAAQELRSHLTLAKADCSGLVFRLGRAAPLDLADLGPCEAKVHIAGKSVDIAGVDGEGKPEKRGTVAGTLFGVYDFLERKVGVRWLWPGELGTIVVGKPNLTDAAWTVRVRAFSEWRTSDNHGSAAAWADPAVARRFFADQNLWLRRHKFSTVGGLNKGHAFTDWYKRFHKREPNLFNELPDKTRRPDPYYQFGRGHVVSMCTTEPSLPAKVIAEWQAERKNGHIVNVNENDVAGKCCCARCLAADGTDDDAGRLARATEKFKAGEKLWWRELGSTSGRYAKFYRAVLDEGLKTDPDCRVIGGIYANYSEVPPDGTQLGDRVILRYCPPIMYPWTDRKVADFKRIWSGWSKTGARLMMRPNFLLDGYNFPLVYYRWFADCYKFAAANDLHAQDFDALTGMFGANGLTLYVVAALNGDVTRSVADLENDYFAAFGRAAEKIRAYMAHFEAVTVKGTEIPPGEPGNMEGGKWANFFTFAHAIFTEEAMRRGFALLDEAEGAEDDPLVRRRVEFLRVALTDACLVMKAQRGFVRAEETGDSSAFARPYRALLAYRAAHERLGYCGRSTMAYLEGRIWPVHLGLVGEKAVEIKGWQVRTDPHRAGDAANWQSDRSAEGWRDVQLKGHLKNPNGSTVKSLVWYRTRFTVRDPQGKVLLTFGAVDGEPKVWLNGRLVQDGHPVKTKHAWKTPFQLNVTGFLKDGSNDLSVRLDKEADGGRGILKSVFVEVAK